MKINLLIILAVTSLISQGANWDLFPLNQKSFYKEHAGFSASVNNYIEVYVDSSYSSGNSSIQLNLKKVTSSLTYGCLQSSPTEINEENLFDTISYRSDTAFCTLSYNRKMTFLPLVTAGSSWTINGYTLITITCDSVLLDSVFGVADSVKYYSFQEAVVSSQPLSSFSMRLSKTFGLLDFVRFDQLINSSPPSTFQQCSLAGLSDTNYTLGFTLPALLDYLPYFPGTILLWDINMDNSAIWQPSWDDYERDSITSAIFTPDSFTYYYDQSLLSHSNQQVTFSSGLYRSFSHTNPESLFNSPPNYMLYFPINNPIYNVTKWMSEEMIPVMDTVSSSEMIQRRFFTYGDQVDTNTCSIYPTIDYEHWEVWNTHLGIIEDCDENNTSPYCRLLKGADISGLHYGNTNLPVGIFDPVTDDYIKCYPSPANEYVRFDLPYARNTEIIIYDDLGNQVINRIILGSEEKISIESLSPGFYTVNIISDVKKFHSKIIRM